jgi:hypothetical protein
MPTTSLRPTRRLAAPALAAAAALLLGGCGLLYAELEIPTVSVTLADQTFAGTPPGTTLTQSIEFDFAANQIDWFSDPSVHKELRLTELSLALTSTPGGITDFGGIDVVDIQVLPPAGSGLPPVVLVHYLRDPANLHPTSVSSNSITNVDLAPYITTQKLRLQATASGTLPTTDWSASVTGTFYMRVKLDYGDLVSRGK